MIACTFSNSEQARNHARRNAVIQIVVATAAFILLMRVFPAGMVQSHTLSKQNAYDTPMEAGLTGEIFSSSDKKLQTVFFMEEHLYQIKLYMQCIPSSETSDKEAPDTERVLFRLYNDEFSCIYEEDIDNRTIIKKGFLTATPDLDVEREKAYYYEILVDEKANAVYRLPVADTKALAQEENSVLYIDGIYHDEVCLVADFDYSRPLTTTDVILYYMLIIVVAAGIYLLTAMLVWLYDVRLSQESQRIGRYLRIGAAAVSMSAAVVLFVFAVALNRFGGEVWDRVFFTVGILVAESWLLGFLWRAPRVIRSKKRAKMSAGSIIGSTWRNYIQTVCFGLLFYALCQYVNADRNFYHYTNTRWMLIFLAVAFLMNYSERQFVNRFSAVWLFLGFVGSVIYCSTARTDQNELLLARLTCGAVVAWGLLVLNILLELVRTKADWLQNIGSRIDRQQVLYIGLWVVFSLLMYVNRYEKVWVFTATLPFLAYLFIPDNLPVKCRFIKNFCNGILLSFGLVTVFCLAHRPHHYWMMYRYGGIFYTVACTGMYLAVVFGAALAKLYGKIRTRRNMLFWGLPEYFVVACAVGYIVLTMSRTAFLTTMVTVILLVALTAAVYRKRARRILSEFGVLAAVCLVSFPMVFTAVRMVPAVVNDPVRYDIDFQDRSFMVYKGDPIDSDKYMTVRRFFDVLLGRFQKSENEEADLGWREAGVLAFTGDSLASLDMRYAYEGNDDENHSKEGKNDISNGRFEIFRVYMREIGLQGHPKMGPLDNKGVEYAHAHNSYLQVAYNFGLIAGIVFLFLCVLTLWRSVKFAMKYGNKYSITLVPFALIVVFGFISLTEWAYHPCIPAGFSFILMQVVLMRTNAQEG